MLNFRDVCFFLKFPIVLKGTNLRQMNGGLFCGRQTIFWHIEVGKIREKLRFLNMQKT